MAKNMQPIAKRCKALGISPAEMGYAKKTTNRNPGGQMRKKKSEYGLQLAEKQKVKFIYGVLEKQFHAHFTVNGKKVNIPSYLVKAGDVIEVAESSRSSELFKRLTGENAPMTLLPAWLERTKGTLQGTVAHLPTREEIDTPVEEHLIVELYSK